MAQVIQPEVWQEGIDDNRLLPGRYTTGLFTGSGVKIANNQEACRVWDIQVTDYITDYDDRRINGLLGNKWGQNADSKYNGNDGWSASAYGVFQDVRFDSRIYTMGRHRSIAMRIFDEMQYSGNIGAWGTATTSNVITNGQALMKTAQLLSKAKDIWSKQVLGPDIDKYNLFAILNGHISGRWVQDNPDQIFSDEGTWVAQPGMVQGQAIPPRFAPIHAIEWDDDNIVTMLQCITVTWTNLFIPEDSRVILIDPYYKIRLMQALWGSGVPATEAAYTDMQNGEFTKLMGWNFRFDIPTSYWPSLYVDKNLNVVHYNGTGAVPAYDALMNSVSHHGGENGEDDAGLRALELELIDSDRMNRPNYVRTEWDPATGTWKKKLVNYPLGMPAWVDYAGVPYEADGADSLYDDPATYPWTAPGSGYGFGAQGWEDPSIAGNDKSVSPTGPITPISRRRCIGMALYQKAAQLSQEYSEMRTAEGETRGKFTEMVMDVKYDAWVIESLSHGILPILETETPEPTFAIPVKVIGTVEMKEAAAEETTEETPGETPGN